MLSVRTDRVLMRVSWNDDDRARQVGLFGFGLFGQSVSVHRPTGSYRLSNFYVPMWPLDLVYVFGMRRIDWYGRETTLQLSTLCEDETPFPQ